MHGWMPVAARRPLRFSACGRSEAAQLRRVSRPLEARAPTVSLHLTRLVSHRDVGIALGQRLLEVGSLLEGAPALAPGGHRHSHMRHHLISRLLSATLGYSLGYSRLLSAHLSATLGYRQLSPTLSAHLGYSQASQAVRSRLRHFATSVAVDLAAISATPAHGEGSDKVPRRLH